MSYIKKFLTFNSIFLVSLIICFAITSATIIRERTDFSGIWVINLKKSEFKEIPIYAAFNRLKVDQKIDSITLNGFNTGENNENISEVVTYALNGKSFERITSDNRKLITNLYWSDDERSLKKIGIYSFDDNQQKEEYKRTEVWGLLNNDSILTIDITVAYKTGYEYSIKAAYDKQ